MRKFLITTFPYILKAFQDILQEHRKPRPMGVVRVPLLCLKDAFEIAVSEGNESRVRPRPMALDSPNQMVSLQYNTVEEICAINWPFLKEVRV